MPTIDVLSANLQKTATVYTNIAEKFSFLIDLELLIETRNEQAQRLIESHPEHNDTPS